MGDGLRLLDPFAGSGTTAVSAGMMAQSGALPHVEVYAAEVNPFLHLVTTAKTAALIDPPQGTARLAETVAERALSEKDGLAPIPRLSTFQNAQYFPTTMLRELQALQASVNQVKEGASSTSARLLLDLALASSVEPASTLRRDGRALRHVPAKRPVRPTTTFLQTSQMMTEDLRSAAEAFISSTTLADSREAAIPRTEYYDLSVFSPPYPNNIDYTEVYKMEAWLLGLYEDSRGFTNQRHSSLRSHSSLKWEEAYHFEGLEFADDIAYLISPIINAVPNDRYTSGRVQVVKGYVDDMLKVLTKVACALKPGGRASIVVGNSLHGKPDQAYVIASDLLIAHLSRLVGFQVEDIQVARYPARRKTRSTFLRESVVTLLKE
ncbi:hypothetical protein [Rathayibacter sp. PhB152]|uniref:hypothetical protein n=1 Tax=Rathayibacter sp. PhB152 TaxID=2485190 RepID=UPI0011CDCD81|nr:hypothetical protein [Rathayibacter sp. PhB152]